MGPPTGARCSDRASVLPRSQPTAQELCNAVNQGDEAAVSELLSRGADANAVDSCGSYSGSALQIAAKEGQGGCVGLLLEAGAAVDQTDEDNGITALMSAAISGHSAVCGQLLEGGADPWIVIPRSKYRDTEEEKTALEVARQNGKAEAVAVMEAWIEAHGTEEEKALAFNPQLLEHMRRNSNIDGTERRNEAAVSKLLSRGADPNAVGTRGSSALQMAAEYGLGGCVGLLLEAGAAVDQADKRNGETALMSAASSGHSAICGQLLEGGADPSLKSTSKIDHHFKGKTALDVARSNGKSGAMALLEAWAAGTRDVAELDKVVAEAKVRIHR